MINILVPTYLIQSTYKTIHRFMIRQYISTRTFVVKNLTGIVLLCRQPYKKYFMLIGTSMLWYLKKSYDSYYLLLYKIIPVS